MKTGLPALPPFSEIQKRLLEIFPEGTPNRGYCTREIAAKTVFVMLYVGAVESRGVYIRPNQVTRMTSVQADRVFSWRSWRLGERLFCLDATENEDLTQSRQGAKMPSWISDSLRETDTPCRSEAAPRQVYIPSKLGRKFLDREKSDTIKPGYRQLARRRF